MIPVNFARRYIWNIDRKKSPLRQKLLFDSAVDKFEQMTHTRPRVDKTKTSKYRLWNPWLELPANYRETLPDIDPNVYAEKLRGIWNMFINILYQEPELVRRWEEYKDPEEEREYVEPNAPFELNIDPIVELCERHTIDLPAHYPPGDPDLIILASACSLIESGTDSNVELITGDLDMTLFRRRLKAEFNLDIKGANEL